MAVGDGRLEDWGRYRYGSGNGGYVSACLGFQKNMLWSGIAGREIIGEWSSGMQSLDFFWGGGCDY